MASLFKKTGKNILFMSILQGFLGIQSFLLLSFLTKFLDPNSFGVFSQIKITLVLLSGLSLMGLDSAIIKFLSGENNNKKRLEGFLTILIVTAISSFFLGLLVFIISEDISVLFTSNIENYQYFRFIWVILIFKVSHNCFITFFRAKEENNSFLAIEFSRSLFELIGVVAVLFAGFGLTGVLIVMALMYVGSNLLGLALSRKEGKGAGVQVSRKNISSLVKYLKFSIPLIFAPFMWWSLQAGDQYILGFYFSAEIVGGYSLAYSLCRILRILVDPIFLVMQPSLNKFWNRNNFESFKEYFQKTYQWSFAIAIPGAVGLSILQEKVIKYFASDQYVPYGRVIPIICAGVVMYIFFLLSTMILSIKKKTVSITATLFSLALFNFCLNLFLIKRYSIYGAAFSTAITFLFAGIHGMRVLKKEGIPLQTKFLLKIVISSLLMGIFCKRILDILLERGPISSEIWVIVVVVISSVVVYALGLFSLGVLKKEDIIKVLPNKMTKKRSEN